MSRWMAVLFLLGCLACLGPSAPAVAEEEGPQAGWYVAAPEHDGGGSMALKIQPRGKVFGVSGVFGNPADTKRQVPFGGTYYPSQKKLAGTWTQTYGKKTRKLPINGTYDAREDAFDVTVSFITQVGPGSYSFHCVRSKTKGKETSLTGTWKVEDLGWTLHLKQSGDSVTGTYSGGSGASKVSGSLVAKLNGNTLAGTYTHREGGETYRGTLQASLMDQNTLAGVWREKKSGASQSVRARRGS